MSGIVHEKRVLPEFHPPANLDDMTPEVQKIWSEKYISYWMTGEIEADEHVTVPGRTPLAQYFNGTVTAFDQSQKVTPVTWNAFPNLVCRVFRNARPSIDSLVCRLLPRFPMIRQDGRLRIQAVWCRMST